MRALIRWMPNEQRKPSFLSKYGGRVHKPEIKTNGRKRLTRHYLKKLTKCRKKLRKGLAIAALRGIIAKPSDEGAARKGSGIVGERRAQAGRGS